MTSRRCDVLLVCTTEAMATLVPPLQVKRLESIGTFRYVPFDRDSDWDNAPEADPAVTRRLIDAVGPANILLVTRGSPRIDTEVFDATGVEFVGELEGDRFARRVDLHAAWARGIRVVDTTNGSSYGVSEWALALSLIGLRDAGSLFRRLSFDKDVIDDDVRARRGYRLGELSGRSVGLIGCGIAGRRLLELLRPFHVQVSVYDPFIPRELADAYDFTWTTLDNVLASSDVVVCLAPLTPSTKGMIGPREISLMRRDTVFVNVSRGAIVQTDALLERLLEDTLIACLDVFDPEPMPADSPFRDLPNVFPSPHIAGVTAAGGERFFSLMVDEIQRFVAGHETRFDLSPGTAANRGIRVTGT